MTDVLQEMKAIHQRAAEARRVITAGREAGVPVNGISALRDIEERSRMVVADLEKQTGAAEATPVSDYPEIATQRGA